MLYNIDEIKKKVIPIIKSFGIKRLCLFGSYVKGMVNDDSDLVFIMDKWRLKCLQYIFIGKCFGKWIQMSCWLNILRWIRQRIYR